MKNIKVLGLAIVASIVAAPAFAGETYVRNEWTDTNSRTHTDLDLKSLTLSSRNEWYGSYANKLYVENYDKGGYHVLDNYDPSGSNNFVAATKATKEKNTDNGLPITKEEGVKLVSVGNYLDNGNGMSNGGSEMKKGKLPVDPENVGGDGLTIHNSGSLLFGKFHEINGTYLSGDIKTWSHSYSKAHETSAGVR